jgi:hypothetical protein
MDIPFKIPLEIQIGDTLQFTDSYIDYPTDSYTIKYYITNSLNSYEFDGVAQSDGSISVSEDTSKWIDGTDYYYFVKATDKDGKITTIESGPLVMYPAYDAAADMRSHARQMLDAIELVLSGQINQNIQRYTIAGRTLERIPIKELITYRDRYRLEVANEIKAAKIARGEKNYQSSIKVGFSSLTNININKVYGPGK